MTCHRGPRELRWLTRLLATTLALCASVTVAAPASADARCAPTGGLATAWDVAALDHTVGGGAGFGAAPGGGATVRAGLEGGAAGHHGAADAQSLRTATKLLSADAPARSVAAPCGGRVAGCSRTRAPPLA